MKNYNLEYVYTYVCELTTERFISFHQHLLQINNNNKQYFFHYCHYTHNKCTIG